VPGVLLAGRVGRATWFYLALIIFSVLGTLATTCLNVDPGPIKPVSATLTLLLAAFLSLRSFVSRSGSRGLLSVFLVGLLGVNVELAGVFTGFPFGRYRYTDQWIPVVHLPRLGFFPLLIPVAWLFVSASCYFIVSSRVTGPGAVVAGGLLGGLLDLLMEPAMTDRLHYWTWLSRGPLPGGVPISNFLSWCVLCMVAGALFRWADKGDVKFPREPLIALLGQLVLTATIWLCGIYH